MQHAIPACNLCSKEEEEELCILLLFLGKMNFYKEGKDMFCFFFFATFAGKAFQEAFEDQNYVSLKFKLTNFERPSLIREIF